MQLEGGSKVRNQSIIWVLVAGAFVLPLVIFAQTAPQAGPSKARAVSAAPDFSGVWFIDEYRRNILPKEDPPFLPWAEAKFKERQSEKLHQDPDSGPDPTERCIPPGIPREMLQPFPWEIVQARDRVIMIFEYQSLIRQIFTDGRGHPKDLQATYMGNSIGRFEGDTLVIDTIGFNDKTWLDPMGLPHSDALHVVERLRRVDHDTLVDEYTIEDPKAYKKSWTTKKTFLLKPDWQIQEYVCTENNNVK
jgi:hypothetical protein